MVNERVWFAFSCSCEGAFPLPICLIYLPLSFVKFLKPGYLGSFFLKVFACPNIFIKFSLIVSVQCFNICKVFCFFL